MLGLVETGLLFSLQVLRRIVLTPEEIVYRRYLIGKRYAETHPDDPRNHVKDSHFSS